LGDLKKMTVFIVNWNTLFRTCQFDEGITTHSELLRA